MHSNNLLRTKKTKTSVSIVDSIPLELLLYAVSALLLIDLLLEFTLSNLIVFGLLLLGASAIIWRHEFNRLLSKISCTVRKGHITVGAVIFLVMALIWLLDLTAAPAHAQFFIATEEWLRSSFPIGGTGGGAGGGAGAGGAGGTDIYALVFNTLRAIFVLYLAIALVRVIAAARNDEDWQNLARTPLIILVTVTLGDILATLIVGQGTGTGGGAP